MFSACLGDKENVWSFMSLCAKRSSAEGQIILEKLFPTTMGMKSVRQSPPKTNHSQSSDVTLHTADQSLHEGAVNVRLSLLES